MGKREVEKKLRRYKAACRKIVPKDKETRIQELLRAQLYGQSKIQPEAQSGGVLGHGDILAEKERRTRGTLFDFVLEQAGYLGRCCLFWQALWVSLFWYLMKYGLSQFIGVGNEKEVLVFISLLPPLLVLLTVEEVTKIYQKSMLEIEYATKYSLRSVVMIRMLFLCIFHAVVLAVCMVCLPARLDTGTGKLLVYGFTPMTVVTGIVLKLMQYCQGELLQGAAIGLYGLTAILAIAGNTEYFGWYQPAYFKVWCVACAAGIVLVGWQFVCLHGKLACFEEIV